MPRKSILIFIGVFIVVNFFWGFLGISSIFLTLSFYGLLGFCGVQLINLFKIEQSKKLNYKLFVIVLLVGLFTVELVLRFGTKSYLSRGERNGDFFYNSPYKQLRLDYFKRKYVIKQHDCQLRIHAPGTSEFIKRHEFNYRHQFNSLGLRGKEPKQDTSVYTILCVGDSFTEGEGAPADSTWPVLFEQLLLTSHPTVNIQCLNAGVSGSDPFYEYLLVERKLLNYRPKMVIVSINQSDIYDAIVRGGFERFDARGGLVYQQGPWWEIFYQFSYIFRNITHSVFKLNMQLMTDDQYEAEVAKAINKIEHCIYQKFKQLSLRKHFRLVVVLHALQYELEQEQSALKPLVQSFKNDSSITIINLHDALIERHKKQAIAYNTLYWPIDMHHTPTGYALWAEVLKEKLGNKIP